MGKITDTSGTPLSGWQIGLAEGGIKTTVTSQGTYQLDPLPRGSVNLRGWSMLPYTDPMTAKPATQYAGIIFPVQSTERYETFDVQINAQVFPMAATPYVPWLAIGSGSFNSLQPSIYYSGGVGAPTGTSRRDSGLQLWMIPPDGKAFTVPTGPREENVIPNPQAGTYTLQGQLPDKPAFSISLKMAF